MKYLNSKISLLFLLFSLTTISFSTSLQLQATDISLDIINTHLKTSESTQYSIASLIKGDYFIYIVVRKGESALKFSVKVGENTFDNLSFFKFTQPADGKLDIEFTITETTEDYELDFTVKSVSSQGELSKANEIATLNLKSNTKQTYLFLRKDVIIKNLLQFKSDSLKDKSLFIVQINGSVIEKKFNEKGQLLLNSELIREEKNELNAFFLSPIEVDTNLNYLIKAQNQVNQINDVTYKGFSLLDNEEVLIKLNYESNSQKAIVISPIPQKIYLKKDKSDVAFPDLGDDDELKSLTWYLIEKDESLFIKTNVEAKDNELNFVITSLKPVELQKNVDLSASKVNSDKDLYHFTFKYTKGMIFNIIKTEIEAFQSIPNHLITLTNINLKEDEKSLKILNLDNFNLVENQLYYITIEANLPENETVKTYDLSIFIRDDSTNKVNFTVKSYSANKENKSSNFLSFSSIENHILQLVTVNKDSIEKVRVINSIDGNTSEITADADGYYELLNKDSILYFIYVKVKSDSESDISIKTLLQKDFYSDSKEVTGYTLKKNGLINLRFNINQTFNLIFDKEDYLQNEVFYKIVDDESKPFPINATNGNALSKEKEIDVNEKNKYILITLKKVDEAKESFSLSYSYSIKRKNVVSIPVSLIKTETFKIYLKKEIKSGLIYVLNRGTFSFKVNANTYFDDTTDKAISIKESTDGKDRIADLKIELTGDDSTITNIDFIIFTSEFESFKIDESNINEFKGSNTSKVYLAIKDEVINKNKAYQLRLNNISQVDLIKSDLTFTKIEINNEYINLVLDNNLVSKLLVFTITTSTKDYLIRSLLVDTTPKKTVFNNTKYTILNLSNSGKFSLQYDNTVANLQTANITIAEGNSYTSFKAKVVANADKDKDATFEEKDKYNVNNVYDFNNDNQYLNIEVETDKYSESGFTFEVKPAEKKDDDGVSVIVIVIIVIGSILVLVGIVFLIKYFACKKDEENSNYHEV